MCTFWIRSKIYLQQNDKWKEECGSSEDITFLGGKKKFFWQSSNQQLQLCALSLPSTQVWFLVGELRSYKPQHILFGKKHILEGLRIINFFCLVVYTSSYGLFCFPKHIKVGVNTWFEGKESIKWLIWTHSLATRHWSK